MCLECDPVIPKRSEILKWLEAYPVPSEEEAGIAGKVASLMKYELLIAWGNDEKFDVQRAMNDLRKLHCIMNGFQAALHPIWRTQMQIQNVDMMAADGGRISQAVFLDGPPR
jgi:hypothetical protein